MDTFLPIIRANVYKESTSSSIFIAQTSNLLSLKTFTLSAERPSQIELERFIKPYCWTSLSYLPLSPSSPEQSYPLFTTSESCPLPDHAFTRILILTSIYKPRMTAKTLNSGICDMILAIAATNSMHHTSHITSRTTVPKSQLSYPEPHVFASSSAITPKRNTPGRSTSPTTLLRLVTTDTRSLPKMSSAVSTMVYSNYPVERIWNSPRSIMI